MPFSMPTTAASQATTGYGAQFLMGSPLTAIAEIKTIKNNGVSLPEVDVTHLLSPNAAEEKRGGLLKPGTLDITGNFIGDSTQLGILAAAKNNAAQNPGTQAFGMTAALQSGTKTYTAAGSGYVADYQVGPIENNKPIEFSMRYQITGIFTETVA